MCVCVCVCVCLNVKDREREFDTRRDIIRVYLLISPQSQVKVSGGSQL